MLRNSNSCGSISGILRSVCGLVFKAHKLVLAYVPMEIEMLIVHSFFSYDN